VNRESSHAADGLLWLGIRGHGSIVRYRGVRGCSRRGQVTCDDSAMGLARSGLFALATSDRFERVVRSTPGGEGAAWHAASRYVAGRSSADALAVAERLLAQGHGVSIDLFGERVRDSDEADRVVGEYTALAAALPAPPADVWLSVDLSHLAITADPSAAAARLAQIAEALPSGRRIQVGAEDAAQADVILRCVLDVAQRGLADGLGATVQSNLVRSAADLDALTDAGVHVRLVKGAYVEAAGALPYGEPTDLAFLELGFRLAERGVPWVAATHDGRLREALLHAQSALTIEQLLGVRPDVLDQLGARKVPTRVYVPYGTGWFRYWMRRVAESRGA
jgi:proline dehydrogenase